MKVQAFFIVLLAVLLASVVEFNGVASVLEMKAFDARLHLRSEWFQQAEESEQIVVIGIDDESIAKLPEPFILWDTFFAEIIEQLAVANAKVLGLDFIWTKRIDDFIKREKKSRNALRRALLIAKNKYRMNIVMGIGAVSRKTQNAQVQIDTSAPLKYFGAIIGQKRFGIVNTLPDSDNYIRRIKLLYLSDDKQKKFPGFSNLVSAFYMGRPISEQETPQLINYQVNKRFKILPFHEVLMQARRNNLDYFRQHFAQRIVLMGMTNVSGDILPSPVSQETPGVLIHAYAIDMLINQNALHTMTPMAFLLLCLVLAMMVVFLSLRFKVQYSALLVLLIVLGFTMANILLFNNNLLIPYVSPVLMIVFAFSASYLYRFVTEERSKRRLARFFRSYVNEQVVQEILESDRPVDLQGKRENVCVLFSDIRGFTSFSEKLPPEEVVQTLNEYFSEMTEAILDNQGTVDKFIGDGLMAFFGAPLRVDNPTRCAVNAALAMRKRLAQLNRKWAEQGRAQLDNGIGLHSGEAIIGNIGCEQKMDYTAIGDVVNTASRVEGKTKELKCAVLITEAAVQQLDQKDLIVKPVGKVPLKGRSDIFVYQVQEMQQQNNNQSWVCP